MIDPSEIRTSALLVSIFRTAYHIWIPKLGIHISFSTTFLQFRDFANKVIDPSEIRTSAWSQEQKKQIQYKQHLLPVKNQIS